MCAEVLDCNEGAKDNECCDEVMTDILFEVDSEGELGASESIENGGVDWSGESSSERGSISSGVQLADPEKRDVMYFSLGLNRHDCNTQFGGDGDEDSRRRFCSVYFGEGEDAIILLSSFCFVILSSNKMFSSIFFSFSDLSFFLSLLSRSSSSFFSHSFFNDMLPTLWLFCKYLTSSVLPCGWSGGADFSRGEEDTKGEQRSER